MQKVARGSHTDQLTKYIKRGRDVMPFRGVTWDSPSWNVSSAHIRAPKRAPAGLTHQLHFGIYVRGKRDREPFPVGFAEFAKAYISLRHADAGPTHASHVLTMRAFSYLCLAVQGEAADDPTKVQLEHFIKAEALCKNEQKEDRAYAICTHLERIAETLDRWSIASVRIDYHSSLASPKFGPKLTKMPELESIELLVDLSARVDSMPEASFCDRVCIRLFDLNAEAGFRACEWLTLPVNPLVMMHDGPYLRYWPEKGGLPQLKPVSTDMLPVVQRAIDQLTELCAPARRMAQWLYENPRTVYFPPDTPDELSYAEAARLANVSMSQIDKWLSDDKLQRAGRHGARTIRRGEFARFLASMRYEHPMIQYGKHSQKLHESLLVVFRNQLHADRGTMYQLVEPFPYHALLAFFSGAYGMQSVFQRYNLVLKNGRTPSLTTHQFRHFAETTLRRGGFSAFDSARFFGRTDVRQSDLYDHRTLQERLGEMRAMIRDGKVTGKMVDVYNGLPPTEQKHFLETQITAALLTPMGACLHDWGQSPCELHLYCLSGCDEYVRTPGDRRERRNLLEQFNQIDHQLELAKRELSEEACNANNWVRHHMKQLEKIDRALALDDELFRDDPELRRA